MISYRIRCEKKPKVKNYRGTVSLADVEYTFSIAGSDVHVLQALIVLAKSNCYVGLKMGKQCQMQGLQ
jgi:hypothetical protein